MQLCFGHNWLSIAILMVAGFVSMPSQAHQIDCGPKPALTCLAPFIFALTSALPDNSDRRRTARSAQEELAPSNLEVALRYYLDDNPDPSEWDDIWWIARAGRFDRAIEMAEAKPEHSAAFNAQRRIGGLVAVAGELAKAGQVRRATKILRAIEPELTPALLGDQGMVLIDVHAAELWAAMGRPDKATQLLQRTNPSVSAVYSFLRLAKKYPTSASLYRREAWKAAERTNYSRVWRQVADEAAKRGDAKAVSAAVSRAPTAEQDDSPARVGTEIARSLIAVGLLAEANLAVTPWRNWITHKDPQQRNNEIDVIVTVLADLGRDAEVEEAARMASGSAYARSTAFGNASDQLLRIGRTPLAEQLESEAITVAESIPPDDPNLRWQHDALLHNRAMRRVNRGDIDGALTVSRQLYDRAKALELTFYTIRGAIATGHGDQAVPALERLQTTVHDQADADLLLKVAELWRQLGRNEMARTTLADALTVQRTNKTQKKGPILWSAASLIWQLDGNLQKIHEALGEFMTSEDERSTPADAAVSAVLQTSPGEAVRLAGKIPSPARRLDALERIATKLANE